MSDISELEPGEQVVWSGQPRPELLARAARVLVPIGALFLIVSVVYTVMVWGIVNPWWSPIGLPFTLVGLWLMMAPRLARRRAQRTSYVLTDRRAIVRQPVRFGGFEVRSFAPPELNQVASVVESEGAGNLIFFVRDNPPGVDDSEVITTARRGFQAIDQVQMVESLVRQTLLGLETAPSLVSPGRP